MSGSEKTKLTRTHTTFPADLQDVEMAEKRQIVESCLGMWASSEVSRCSRAKQRQRNVQKSVLHVQSCFFAN